MKSVGIVGGGIIGLATAEALLEDFSCIPITVYSLEFSPNTTADLSAGWIYPSSTGEEQDPKDLAHWTKCTIDHLVNVSNEDPSIATAISPISGYLLYKNGPVSIPYYVQNCFPGGRLVGEAELGRITKKKFAGCVFATTWSCECSIYLPFIMKKLQAQGVKFVQRKITSFDEVANMGHDVVVNCAGFGAKYLANDTSLQPVRGQVFEVRAPWIKHFVVEVGKRCHVLPKRDTVIVGGTHEINDSIVVDQEASKIVWSNACNMFPRLREATIVRESVGIRPVRSKIRIETEEAETESGKRYVILHHYGHGGSGVTLHWGCAKHASAVLKRFLRSNL